MMDYDMSIHTNPDARAWAKFYKETFPDADEELMIGWFANAMMAMYDWVNKTGPLNGDHAEFLIKNGLV
jgi:hypothetical protein